MRCADIFVSTPFSGEERHVRRVSKLIELDKYLEKNKEFTFNEKPTGGHSPTGRFVFIREIYLFFCTAFT